MKRAERAAFTQAEQNGYLAEGEDVGYGAHELWYQYCQEHNMPAIFILGTGETRTVIFDTDSVYMHYHAQGKPLLVFPLLTPTEKTLHAVERLVRRYARPWWQARWGASYTALYGVDPAQAENVVQELRSIWNEAEVLVDQPVLWPMEVA